MTTTGLTMRTYRSESRWSQYSQCFAEWRRRVRTRDELSGLSDATLRDIGITRCDAHFEAAKPFWMA